LKVSLPSVAQPNEAGRFSQSDFPDKVKETFSGSHREYTAYLERLFLKEYKKTYSDYFAVYLKYVK
jgi:hypothetical protein